MNQKGKAVTQIAARLLEIYCSAQATDTVPPNNMRIPQMELTFREDKGGVFSPLTKHQPHKRIPATKNRMADIRKGGMLFIPKRMIT